MSCSSDDRRSCILPTDIIHIMLRDSCCIIIISLSFDIINYSHQMANIEATIQFHPMMKHKKKLSCNNVHFLERNCLFANAFQFFIMLSNWQSVTEHRNFWNRMQFLFCNVGESQKLSKRLDDFIWRKCIYLADNFQYWRHYWYSHIKLSWEIPNGRHPRPLRIWNGNCRP